MPVPDFSPGEVLTAAAMDSIGLWLVGTFTLAGTTTNCNNIFSSDYTNYRVVLSGVAVSSSDNILMRYRTVAADSDTTIYDEYFSQINAAGTLTGVASLNRQSNRLGFFDTSKGKSGLSLDIYGPNTTEETTATFNSMQNGVQNWAGGYVHRSTSAFTGLRFFSPATMSGTVAVYGYRN
jgi:hypothetical protein